MASEEERNDERLRRAPQPGEVVAVRCGFCGGRGIYPFGHPPSGANCGVCNGRGWVYIRAPYAPCPACRGTGRILGQWMTCRPCRGKGVVPVRESVHEEGG
ncbi:MAG: hypothetical protein L6435_15220 [Anaerolineae bacterium]|nr:hypothetical protein [Anaerolineae bacterium]